MEPEKGKKVQVDNTVHKHDVKHRKGDTFSKQMKEIGKMTNLCKIEARENHRQLQSFFLGPKGQNTQFFTKLITASINSNHTARMQYQMEDYRHITRDMKNQKSFLDGQDKLERELNYLVTKLRDLSPPYFSSRYYGHMCWENTIPSLVGYFAGMLYNPNNTAYEASPFTTLLEIEVLKLFAEVFKLSPMLGSDTKPDNTRYKNSWGHLTCGGTVANCEGLWAARNCRFLALSLRKYIQELQNAPEAKAIKVPLPDKTQKELLKLTGWQILNIDNDDIMELNERVFKIVYDVKEGDDDEEVASKYSQFQDAISYYTIGKAGIVRMYDYLREIPDDVTADSCKWKNGIIPSPIVLLSATKHYSLPKSLSILGFGEGGVQKIEVDLDSRISIIKLRAKLQDCLDKHIPVLSVVPIIGSTEESVVDNLEQIINLKAEFAKKNLYFHLHIDGAYGGYFCSMLIEKSAKQWNSFSEHVEKQLKLFHIADSITFDPHKTGYVPYSCGGIIYKNHKLRDNLSFSAPYIYTGAEPNMAIYGVEGSKPGSAVTSVYLSLAVLPLERSGHGQLIERTMMNTKIFCSSLYRMKERLFVYHYTDNTGKQCIMEERFEALQFSRRPSSKDSSFSEAEENEAFKLIAETDPTKMESVIRGTKYEKYYLELGPDMNIPCFGVNYTGNKSLKAYNEFNKKIIELSKPVGTDVSIRCKPLYVSETSITKDNYGPDIFNSFTQRHGLTQDTDSIVLIRSTIMNAFFTELSGGDENNEIFIRQLSEASCEALLALNIR